MIIPQRWEQTGSSMRWRPMSDIEELIVVDFGTATTFDYVSPRGEYMGGAIAPGIGISAEALFQRTSKLPRVEIIKPRRLSERIPFTVCSQASFSDMWDWSMRLSEE